MGDCSGWMVLYPLWEWHLMSLLLMIIIFHKYCTSWTNVKIFKFMNEVLIVAGQCSGAIRPIHLNEPFPINTPSRWWNDCTWHTTPSSLLHCFWWTAPVTHYLVHCMWYKKYKVRCSLYLVQYSTLCGRPCSCWWWEWERHLLRHSSKPPTIWSPPPHLTPALSITDPHLTPGPCEGLGIHSHNLIPTSPRTIIKFSLAHVNMWLYNH